MGRSFWLRMRVVLLLFTAVAASAQTKSVETKSTFPLSDSSKTLDRTAIDEALALARAKDVDTTIPAALLYHGLMLFQEEKYAECIPFLEESLRVDPSLQAGWEGLGWAYIRTGDQPKALRLWEYFQ